MGAKKQKVEFNLIDYVKSNLEPISVSNFNNLDFAVFSMLSYINFEYFKRYINRNKLTKTITIKDLFNLKYFDTFFSKSGNYEFDYNLFVHVAASPRFHNLELRYFEIKLDTTNTEEFCALTLMGEDFKVITYQGTVSKSYYGFKEDFDMTYRYPVPSQISALNYLEKELRIKDKLPIFLTGHSKGGTLALYAYDNLDIKRKSLINRINGIYAFDSPGIEGRSHYYLKKQNFLKKFVPSTSIIGMIFENIDVVNVVQAKGGVLEQHSIMNWEVDLENNDFIYENNLSETGIKFRKIFGQYIESKDKQDREYLINLIFNIIKDHTNDENKISIGVIELYKEYKQLRKSKDKEESAKIKSMVVELVTTLIKGLI